MTIEELVGRFYHKLNGPDDATAEDAMREVVRALRDELQFWENDCHACDRASGTFREILGDAGEKVAEYTGGMNDLSVTPATDPAPAVCVWAYDVRTDPWPWRSSCGNGWRDSKRTCPQCKKQVKFTEANHG